MTKKFVATGYFRRKIWGMSYISAHPPIAFSMPLRLESHPQTELNVPALFAAAGQDSLVSCDGRISPGEQVRARIDEQVRVVEEVEEFRAELPPSCLRAGA